MLNAMQCNEVAGRKGEGSWCAVGACCAFNSDMSYVCTDQVRQPVMSDVLCQKNIHCTIKWNVTLITAMHADFQGIVSSVPGGS